MGGLHERMEKQGLACLQRSNVLVFVLESFPSCLAVEELFILDIFSLPWRALRFVSRCCEAPGDTKLVQLAESCIIKGVVCAGQSWNEAFTNAYAQRRQLPCHELRGELSGKGMPEAKGGGRTTAQSMTNFKVTSCSQGLVQLGFWYLQVWRSHRFMGNLIH